jgi:hypothetical protein
MNRLLAILLTVMMLAPQASTLLIPAQDQCQEARDHEHGGVCDVACSLCVCCASRTPGLIMALVTGHPDELPALATVAAVVAPLSPPPTDILHVPKSL